MTRAIPNGGAEAPLPVAMRLITFTPKTAPTSAPRAGALLPGDESVLNFSVAVDASAGVPLAAWFDLDDEWLPKVRQIHDSIVKNAARVETLPRGSVLSRANARIGPPVPRPGKIICIGLNYRDHAAESNMPVPSSPVTFSKAVTSVTGPGSRSCSHRPLSKWTMRRKWRSSSDAAPKYVPIERALRTSSAT